MTAKQLFSKTTPFIIAKLMLGGATVLISALLLAIMMGLGWLFGEGGMLIMFILWVSATGAVRFAIMHYAGYLVKAGHIAVIAEACATGKIPDNQVAYGQAMVTERFVSSNVYFAIDKLITGAVKQIQKSIGKVGDFLDFIPGMDAITGLAQFFVDIALGYVDECCLGWTFYHKEQDPFKSSADGVVIYAQNWKPILKGAAKTMLKVVGLTLLIALIIFVPIGLIFKLLKWSPLFAFLLALLIAWVVKFAVMDSYIMIQMMSTYMDVAPSTVITFDLYSKLCVASSSFKELFNKGQAASPQTVPAAAAPTPVTASVSATPAVPTQTVSTKPIFCGQCGAKNEAGTKFCGSCGAKL